jgi:lipid-binding SYLF domain-containing protein
MRANSPLFGTAALLPAALTMLLGQPLGAQTAQQRLASAATVLSDILAAPDKGIPQDVLDQARCIVIVPGMTNAKYAKGFVSCRNKIGQDWSAPAAVRLEGGSGNGESDAESDVILLVMTEQGARRMLSDGFPLREVAAGPVGRSVAGSTAVNVKTTAEILGWSRSQGVFAGRSLQGAALHQDLEGNGELYGQRRRSRAILTPDMAVPEAARPLLEMLNTRSPLKKAGG